MMTDDRNDVTKDCNENVMIINSETNRTNQRRRDRKRWLVLRDLFVVNWMMIR